MHTSELILISPLIFLCFCSCVLLVFGIVYQNTIFITDKLRVDQFLLKFSLLLLILLSAVLATYAFVHKISLPLFYNFFFINYFTLGIQCLLFIFSFIIVLITSDYEINQQLNAFELRFLFLVSLIGANLLVCANDLLAIYLALELQTMPLYILTAAFRTSKKSIEAAIKYFILSIFASGLFLFGFALLYYISGLTNLNDLEIFSRLTAQTTFSDFRNTPVYYVAFFVALLLVFSALIFKLAAAPFHFWIADVYDGAPLSVILVFASLPKLSVCVVLLHLVQNVFVCFSNFWCSALVFTGVLSIIIGTFGAFYHNKITRILAFGSIAHIGYILLAFLPFNSTAIFAVLFYFIIYILTTFLFFICLFAFTVNNEYPKYVYQFDGLFYNSKKLAVFLALSLFSFAGIPPLAGFVAKLFVLQILINYKLILIAGLVFVLSVISAVYYLRIIKNIYFIRPSDKQNIQLFPFRKQTVLLSISLSLLLLFVPLWFM
jgi:NADH-quinone oxidoreductase subunit N